MINNARVGPHQTQQSQPDVHTSRIRRLRILGWLQISLGFVCGILGIVGVILSNTVMNSRCNSLDYSSYGSVYGSVTAYSYHHCGNANTVFIMDLISMAMSGWVSHKYPIILLVNHTLYYIYLSFCICICNNTFLKCWSMLLNN